MAWLSVGRSNHHNVTGGKAGLGARWWHRNNSSNRRDARVIGETATARNMAAEGTAAARDAPADWMSVRFKLDLDGLR